MIHFSKDYPQFISSLSTSKHFSAFVLFHKLLFIVKPEKNKNLIINSFEELAQICETHVNQLSRDLHYLEFCEAILISRSRGRNRVFINPNLVWYGDVKIKPSMTRLFNRLTDKMDIFNSLDRI